MPAAAVVVDVGAQISHAVIVSRELGMPCVVSATDATRRIPDGALIEVNGDTGTRHRAGAAVSAPVKPFRFGVQSYFAPDGNDWRNQARRPRPSGTRRSTWPTTSSVPVRR